MLACIHCGELGPHLSTCPILSIRYGPSRTATKRHPSSQRFHDILKGLGALHDKKQKDYGTDADPFNNVRAGAKGWGISAWVAAMLRATDKIHRLQKFADKGELANESVIDAFDDLAVYAVIARVMYEGEADQRAWDEATPKFSDIGYKDGTET